jgi:hypothetical protein
MKKTVNARWTSLLAVLMVTGGTALKADVNITVITTHNPAPVEWLEIRDPLIPANTPFEVTDLTIQIPNHTVINPQYATSTAGFVSFEGADPFNAGDTLQVYTHFPDSQPGVYSPIYDPVINATTPEPGYFVLLAAGLPAMFLVRRKRIRRNRTGASAVRCEPQNRRRNHAGESYHRDDALASFRELGRLDGSEGG